ncbi:hypothetical protein ACHHZC_16640 [Citrobacter freundii complex sp. 2024EL-00228]|jgi:hypothetical protein|uniref:Uncharacterized protein n=1 Tax=Citrobacter freundii TaxID=546 RepID=A0A9P3Z5N4_CITFR|nr:MULTISPECIES: hypothetical protein [Citrobacter]EIX7374069.1 hypothetical protein [Citrobacter freundii]EJC8214833.1 hypothetical protein [Citrobacter freundii]EJM7587664.1 hypothetical protein [Citrobacter freundii]EKU2553204.1 hypothetical protein [Citrobacter freundii]EKW0743352.1 hypothetical protein [Citrobacter freundii]
MNSKITIEKLVALGLTEYKARHLINLAQNESLSLQKAYYESYCRIFRADMALLSIFLFFFVSILVSDDRDGLFVLLFLALLYGVGELFFRFHKGCWKKVKIYFALKEL